MRTLSLIFRPTRLLDVCHQRIPSRLSAKSLTRPCLLLLLVFLITTLAYPAPPTFKHIIIVVQENRTPDNLFGSNPTFELGVDLQAAPAAQPWCLGSCFTAKHSHDSWTTMWNGGGPNWNNGQGACSIELKNYCFEDQKHHARTTYCNNQPVQSLPACPQQTYVSGTDDNSVVQPYFDIAKKYGFANYMFQTNQGPSFPAHQFLFSGTSAPNGVVNQTDYQYFASENAKKVGCNVQNGPKVPVIDQSGNELNPDVPPVRPCFSHNSLPTLLDSGGISWRYYASTGGGWETSIWTAPNSISQICMPRAIGDGGCLGSDWLSDVVHGKDQILSDIASCNLAQVSWVIPNDPWSDHPGFQDPEYRSEEIEGGPLWVASIINAVGTSWAQSNGGHQCDYWGDHTPDSTKNQPTAIFVVWDDWGGWWDHVDPLTAVPVLLHDHCTDWGCGYVYGFRVPFLTISAFTTPGYVSGDTRTPGGGKVAPYIHDFGSILGFVEYNFLGSSQIGNINRSNNYPFADAFAPEIQANQQAVPLADFFPIPAGSPLPFQQIIVPAGTPEPSYFTNYNGFLGDPDNDAVDDD